MHGIYMYIRELHSNLLWKPIDIIYTLKNIKKWQYNHDILQCVRTRLKKQLKVLKAAASGR